MNKKTIEDVEVQDKRVLVRVDLNVPIKDGKVIDETRIKAVLPTIKYLCEHGAKVILVTHLGRPKGKVVPEKSVKPVADRLSKLLGKEVLFASDCGGAVSQEVVNVMEPGQVVLLENVRFYAGEEKNDPEMSNSLAALGDVFVNDAFGTAHRAHASTYGVAKLLPAYAGFVMKKEIYALSQVTKNPEKPFGLIVGGAKVSDKIGVMKNLIHKVDFMLIGGGMANTFLRALNHETGSSLVEEDKIEVAKEILEKALQEGVEVILPQDVVIADSFSAEAEKKVVPVSQVPVDWRILDIGPLTVKDFARNIERAQTLVWNGPLGVYEFEKFAVGTNEVAHIVANARAKTVIGGGDVVAAVEKTGLADKIYHISTGGGASLEFLEGKQLPGVEVIQDERGA